MYARKQRLQLCVLCGRNQAVNCIAVRSPRNQMSSVCVHVYAMIEARDVIIGDIKKDTKNVNYI